jgi:hypothetical protein
MARTCAGKQPFDFENAAVGQPGPDGSPIVRTFITRNGIPGVETNPGPGVRSVHFPLAALRRQPVVRGIIPPPPKVEPARRPARVAQMLALGHRIQAALDSGEYKDQAAAARALGVTRMRVTQLLNLTFLAPDIQEEILFMEAVAVQEPLAGRELREVVRSEHWADQRRAFQGALAPHLPPALTAGSAADFAKADACPPQLLPTPR